MAKTLKEAFKSMLEKDSKFSTSDADFLRNASNADLIAFAVVNRAKKNASVNDVTLIAKITGDLTENKTVINNYTPLDRLLQDGEQK